MGSFLTHWPASPCNNSPHQLLKPCLRLHQVTATQLKTSPVPTGQALGHQDAGGQYVHASAAEHSIREGAKACVTPMAVVGNQLAFYPTLILLIVEDRIPEGQMSLFKWAIPLRTSGGCPPTMIVDS